MNQKTFSADFTEKATTNGETSFTAVITTNAIDRDSEVVIPAGMNSKDYERNPVLLYAHDPLKPIGIMRKMRRGESSIDADFVLAPRPEDHEGEWFPDTIGALIKFGALKGVSIGYVPSEGGLRNATKSDSEKYGASVKRVYSKWRLMEVSVVSVPANQDALIMAVSKGLVTRAALLALGCEVKSAQRIVEVTPKVIRTVRVTVPSIGRQDVIDAARREVAKMRGHFRA